MDMVQFGVMVTLNVVIGMVTPPVGVCLFVAANIGKITLSEIAGAIWPFLICNITVLFLVSYVPQIALWLPGLFYK